MEWNNIIKNIENLNNPNKKSFDLIHNFLNSERKELNDLMEYYKDKNNRRVGSNIKLCDDQGNYKRIHHKGKDNEKILFMYASYNRKYLELAEKQYNNILRCGYDGDIIIYYGGYPNISNGGLKYANLPYSFKAVSLLECERLNYKYYMWLDCAAIVQKNFNFIFDILKENDFYLNLAGKLKHNHINPNYEKVGFKNNFNSMQISFDKIQEKRIFGGTVYGINLKSSKGLEFLKLNKKFLDMSIPYFCPCSDTAVMLGILHILYPDSDPPNFPPSISNVKNERCFYYDTNH
jgi:hypothetical protein